VHDWTSDEIGDTSYDAILLDAPCSNTGVMRRRIDVRWRLQQTDITRHAELQKRLLEGVREALKPGGRIIYSTCSIDPEENDKVAKASGLEIEKTVDSLPWRDGFDGAYAVLLRG
jgi:16S rRNA (cytosine967-C5)-methyltransferase